MNTRDRERKFIKRILLKYNLADEQDSEKILEIYDQNRINFISESISLSSL